MNSHGGFAMKMFALGASPHAARVAEGSVKVRVGKLLLSW